MSGWRDLAMEKELCVEGLDRQAAGRTFAHLTRYLRKPLPEIAQAYWEQKRTSDVQAQLQAARGQSNSEVNRYYAETPQYLYELSYWEATKDKQNGSRSCGRPAGGRTGGECWTLGAGWEGSR